MKNLSSLLILILVVLAAHTNAFAIGVAAEQFTCEKIKEKSVRAACIKSREGEATVNQVKKEKDASIEQFVIKAKSAVAANLKDPQSAQFSNLFVAEREGEARTLCGMLNAKNSYGGYGGPKMFFSRTALKYENGIFKTLIDDEKSGSINLELIKIYCERDRSDTVIRELN